MNFNINVNTDELNIISCVSKNYKNFVEPFIAFCNESNPGIHIELWIDNPDKFSKFENEKIKIHKLPIKNASAYRYIVEPTLKTKYTYISDIDILYTEIILPFHLIQIKKTGLPFSNIVRKNELRLSGLHFVDSEAWYRDTQKTRKNLEKLYHDEKMLYHIASENYDISKVPVGLVNRPVHGIHCSTEGKPRDPYSAFGWEITGQKIAMFDYVVERYGLFNEYFEEKIYKPLKQKEKS